MRYINSKAAFAALLATLAHANKLDATTYSTNAICAAYVLRL